jgi:tetratricopeptide (TPR) repeat protein
MKHDRSALPHDDSALHDEFSVTNHDGRSIARGGSPSARLTVSQTARLMLAWFCVAVSFACATTPLPSPAASDVPRLEAAFRTDSTSTSTRIQLAAAYRAAGDAARAVTLLEPMVARTPADPVPVLYLGLAYEDLDRIADARRLYESFLVIAPPSASRRRVERRVALLGELELRAAARQAVAGESATTDRTPAPRSVGVFPFLVTGLDATLRPLGRAFAEMLTTDLAQTDRLRVLERAALQHLANELELAESGYVDPATAARAGRMLSAANIVQGRLDGGQPDLAVRALVIGTTARDSAGRGLQWGGGVARLFEIEKNVAFGVYAQLGIQLTTAERERINRRQTENVQALIAFGFGLEAKDAGRWAEAASHFARAAQLDPSFTRARELETEVQTYQAAGTTLDLAETAARDFDLRLSTFQRERMTIDVLIDIVPVSVARDPTVEVLGTEGLERGGIDIIIRRPSGSVVR